MREAKCSTDGGKIAGAGMHFGGTTLAYFIRIELVSFET